MGGRLFRHGELPLVVLAMLHEYPMHGYELLGRIAAKFEQYQPSPGSVYPAVSALEEQGLVEGVGDGRRTIYSVTAEGAVALQARREVLALLEQRLGVEITPGPLERLIAEVGERIRALEPVVGADALRRIVGELSEKLDGLAAGTD
jgi:DNA-binding PadR family transcriptional regulator